MSENARDNRDLILAAALPAAIVFTYATVLVKLGRDWWSDENYSHGLLVPFVIGLIIWREWDTIKTIEKRPSLVLGAGMVAVAMLLLVAGTLGSELFTQRISFVLMLAGVTVCLFGTTLARLLATPLALLLLSIPIPQIVFNRIAFPLQIWASQVAVWGIRLFEVPTLRKGNVIDILPRGSTQTISLEVVEACSGIRSLMTLVVLALILAYFTRRTEGRLIGGFAGSDLVRAVTLMISAVFIAVLTNAGRVTATGIFTYYYGKQATESTIHEASGLFVYVIALGLLIGLNTLLKKVIRRSETGLETISSVSFHLTRSTVMGLAVSIVLCGLAVNWFVNRGETPVERRPLTELAAKLGDWQQRGDEIKFGEDVNDVLRTSDYTMREYSLPDGRMANIYVGYYATQRTGVTYHSPQNCLPGAGWVLSDPQIVDVTTADGKVFKANRYVIENGPYREVMIYWYQGRGRIEASEYRDKLNTIFDSVTRRRTDGAMVRVMTDVGPDDAAAQRAALDLAARLEEQLSPFIPD